MVNVNLTHIISFSQFQDRVSAKERVGVTSDIGKFPMATEKRLANSEQGVRSYFFQKIAVVA